MDQMVPANNMDIITPDRDVSRPDSGVEFEPQPPQLKRLTNRQYRHAVHDFFGLELPVNTVLGTDTQLHGFRNIASAVLSVSETEAEGYEASAQWVAGQLVAGQASETASIDCSMSDVSCVESLIERLGALLWRRGLTNSELTLFVDTWLQLGDQPFSDEERMELLITALLQSPYFLYVIEQGEVDPLAPTARRRTARELLTAVTMLIWDAPPDQALLDNYGDVLYDDGKLDSLLDTLLSDPKARRGLLGFFEEYLQLDRLSNVDKSREHFPLMSDTIADAFHQEAIGLIGNVVLDNEADIRTILSTKESYLNWELGQLYNVSVGQEFQLHRFADNSPRQGFLTTGAFLALNAHHSTTSPTYRGKYVQNRFFCFDIPPPPEGVDTTLAPLNEGRPATMRDRVAQHNSDPVCNGCHQFMDPIGLAFENFDALGAWRTDEAGLPIDASGILGGVEFRNHHALIEHLATQTDFAECVTRQFVRYAWNRLELDSDNVVIAELDQAFAASGYRFESLVRAVVHNRSFRALAEVERE